MKHGIRFVVLLVWCASLSTMAVATVPQPDDRREELVAAERQRATKELDAAVSTVSTEKRSAAELAPKLDASTATARKELEELQAELLSASSSKDMGLIKAVQADLEAARARGDVAATRKMLSLRRVENAAKEQDAWNRRLQSLDLAQQMGLKVMLATTREIESRDKMLDAAAREVDYQLSQIRKYASRRQKAVVTLQELSDRKEELKNLLKTTTARQDAVTVRFLRAIDANIAATGDAIDAQQEWFLMNKMLETRSRRNLSFSRFDYKTRQQYAAALKKKESGQISGDLQAQAEKAEAELDSIRAGMDEAWSAAKKRVSDSAKEVDSAVAAIAQAATADEQAKARAAREEARDRHASAQARNDFLEEYFSLRKAVSGFIREKADRAKSSSENNTVDSLNRELMGLRESARTSEEYVTGMKTIRQKLQDQADACAREAAMSTGAMAELRRNIDGILASHLISSRPDPRAMMEGLISLCTNTGAALQGPTDMLRKQDAAGRIVFTVASQAALNERLSIAVQWLDNTRNAIRSAEKRIADLMWAQSDPRFNLIVFHEFASLGDQIVSDALFARDTFSLGVATRAGCASGARILFYAGLLIVVVILVVLIRGHLKGQPGIMPWLAAESAKALPYVAAGVLLMKYVLPGNMCAVVAGMGLVAAALRYLLYLPLMACCKDRVFPRDGAIAAFLLAIRTVITAGAIALVGWAAVAHLENRQDMVRVVRNLWVFAAGLAAVRLLLDPRLLGRLVLNSRSRAGMRTAWSTATAACLVGAAFALAPAVLSLDNMTRMVMLTVWECLSVVVAAFVVLWLAGLILRRLGLKGNLLLIFTHVARAVVAAGLVTSLGFVWWGLANDIILSPDAPVIVQAAVVSWSRGWEIFMRGWTYNLGDNMTVGRLVWGLACFIASFWVASLARKLFLKHVLARTPMDETTKLTFATVLGYLIVITGFLVGLNIAGSSLKNLALLAGAITVGLGFGLQNIINNFVSSLLIHFGRTIRVGDYIEVGGSRGTVHEIGFRNTRITTDDGVTVLVPNGAFVGGNIINWTNPKRQARLHVPVSVSRQVDQAAAMRLLVEIATAHAAILKDPPPTIEIKSVSADKLGMELLAWTGSPERMAATIGDLSLEIDKKLRQRNMLA